MRDFLAEFQAKIAKINGAGIQIIPTMEPAVSVEPPAEIPVEDSNVRRFNVHKRSLPPGSPPMDVIVFFNVSKEHGAWLVEKVVKTRLINTDDDESKTLIYFDLVPVDATPRERSIYYNPKPVTTEDAPGFDQTRWID